MKLSYFSDTDTLYIDLADRPSVDSDEVSPDIVLDMDALKGASSLLAPPFFSCQFVLARIYYTYG